ncbi:MAG: endonuclease domain-containing protein [Bacteroidia bacterium]
MKNRIIPYNPKLKDIARKLRKQGILSEVIMWKKIKGKSFGVEFHRQVPIDEFIVDFYCHELMLAIEIDGSSHDYEEAYERDLKRQRRLESLGVKIVRFLDKDVKKDLNNVMRALEVTISDIKESDTSP